MLLDRKLSHVTLKGICRGANPQLESKLGALPAAASSFFSLPFLAFLVSRRRGLSIVYQGSSENGVKVQRRLELDGWNCLNEKH